MTRREFWLTVLTLLVPIYVAAVILMFVALLFVSFSWLGG